MTNPNVLLLVCDQMRAFEVGCYGNAVVRTPNIDRLAARGTRFATAVTNNPVCSPARSIMLTGQYSRTCNGMLGNAHENPPCAERVRMLDTTLPEAFRAAGYATALIGKWHIDPQPQLVGFDNAVYPDFEHQYYGQRYWNDRGESWIVDEFANDYELVRLQAYLKEDREQPFFLFYNISQPHQPIGPGHMPDQYCTMYAPDAVPLRPNVPEDLDPENARYWYNIYTSAAFFWRHLAKQEQSPEDLVDDDFGIRDLTALYYGAVTMVDDYVGKVMAALDAAGQAENTIVVFTSDHGDNLGSHGRFNKNALIEESIRVPMIIHDPRHPRHVVADDGVASLVDLMPTMLELAEVPVPSAVQGASLAPATRGETGVLSPRTFIETGAEVGVRTLGHLYGLGHDEGDRSISDDRCVCYDLHADPYEFSNLASPPDERLDELLRRWDADTPWLDAPSPVSIWEYLEQSHWVDGGST
ncbi:MAG: sulfatase-like hydrolase/transferase [Planctomycetota bacterium]|jgi:choline-sulfatase|nr:sulfatase-like hydrolase/transferase [Planctomycetota bacterium]